MVCAAGPGQNNYTTFIYVSDDVLVPWASLLGWAEDTALLEPLGYNRGFLRTGVAPWSGKPTLTDATAGCQSWGEGSVH